MPDPRCFPSARPAHAHPSECDGDNRLERTLATLLIGESRSMRQLRAAILRMGASTLPVLVVGPTGAGKEVVARALHVASRRPGGLVAFNVCAVADALFESAVFGHVRGAFTGAVADSPGYLAEADRGTAFLDEVGALPLAAQAKLLRAVELHEFRPVGAARDRRSDFRVVSATNDDVEQLVRAGRFRADLAERLGGIVLEVPPLAARRDDIPALVAHFVALAAAGARQGGSPHARSPHERSDAMPHLAEFSPEALALLQAHAWPRNVRQLRHAVERALAWSPDGFVDAATARAVLPGDALRGDARRSGPRCRTSARTDAFADLSDRGMGVRPNHRIEIESVAAPLAVAATEADFQRRRLIEVLRACDGDTGRAATSLGVSRATVYRRMARLGVAATE